MGTIAVDFDGVLHAYTKGWHDGTIYDVPVRDSFVALRVLMRQHAVFVHTTRNARQVADWLTRYGHELVVFTEEEARKLHGWDGRFWNQQGAILVTDRKLPALAYVDDRGIRFLNWFQALNALEHYGVITRRKDDAPGGGVSPDSVHRPG